MAVNAVTLEEAIANTNSRVAVWNVPKLLQPKLATFNNQWVEAFSPSKEGDTTVRNWAPQSRAVQLSTPAAGNSSNVQQRQDIVNVVCRILYATQASLSAGRISGAQKDAVLGAWNAAFGIDP